MRNFKKLLIPAVILVLLIGAYLIVTNLPEKEETDSTNKAETISIFDFKKDDLSEILIEREDGIMQFRYVTIQVEQEKTDDKGNTVKEMVDRNVWQAVQPEGMNVNSSSIDTIAWNANTLKASKVIEENPSNLAVYGLDKPVKLTFTMKDGTKYILLLGKATPVGSSYYAKTANDPTVYTIGSYESEKFLQTKLELLVKGLYEKEYMPADFSTIKFYRKNDLIFDAYAEEETVWNLTYPISSEANYSNIYTITNALAAVIPVKYVEEDVSDLGKYGLASPPYVFEYKVDGKEYKLSLGGKDPDSKNYYALMNDSGMVFTLSPDNFTFLDKPVEEIVSSFVYIVNIADVKEMRVTIDGRTDISRMNVNSEDDSKSTYEFNGTLLEEANEDDEEYISLFKKYYQGAIGLTVDKIDKDVQPQLVNPEVKIEYELHSGEKVVVELVPTPDGVSFYAFRNGKYTGITLRQRQLVDENNNGLRVSYPKLADALKERNK